jgi:hypothetical protein
VRGDRRERDPRAVGRPGGLPELLHAAERAELARRAAGHVDHVELALAVGILGAEGDLLAVRRPGRAAHVDDGRALGVEVQDRRLAAVDRDHRDPGVLVVAAVAALPLGERHAAPVR